MIEILIEHIIDPALVAVFGLGIWLIQRHVTNTPSPKERHKEVMERFKDMEGRMDASDEALLCLMRDRINQLGSYARKNGYWDDAAHFQAYSTMYDKYKRAGGNGHAIDDLYNATIKLPIGPTERKEQ